MSSKSTPPTGPGPSYKDHHFRSNANLGPRPTPTIPDGGKWSVYAETTINTPPSYPYHALLNIHDWPQWNTYNPDCLITKHPSPHARSLKMEQGTFMLMTVQMTPSERVQTKERCMHLEPLKTRNDGHASHASGLNITRVRWCSDNANYLTPGFVMRSERVNEFEEDADPGRCKYRTWITMSGLASKGYRKKYGEAMREGVAGFCRDLKERSEKLYREEGGGGAGGKAEVGGHAVEQTNGST